MRMSPALAADSGAALPKTAAKADARRVRLDRLVIVASSGICNQWRDWLNAQARLVKLKLSLNYSLGRKTAQLTDSGNRFNTGNGS
jgi:hypothetical protein